MLIIETRLGLKLKKRNNKSVVYEIGRYTVKVSDGAYSHRSQANESFISTEGELGDFEYFDVLYITNNRTGKTRQTRVYQHLDVLLQEIENDFNDKKKQFPWPE
ncbi:hypothetical protein J31TS6_07880 [Brevibacillus reuszeri]|uniref:hypothetical protein n=1 Tax=Brevibacillus reuszeri TaxID=54915 RepID=UPI001B002610|nr:hypothetical protein [Brevibacillus reuszeri]GIO04760.1 hypothetical protein J31TS6_07880 [Brevibacillus reuszeri]